MKTKLNLLAAGMFLAATSNALAGTVRYVDVNSASPTPPFLTWATAATNIQDAVDAAVAGDEIVVTNGVYGTGGRAVSGTMTNRVVVDKPTALRSVNGPQFTVIQGYQVPYTTNGDGAIRCVYLTNGASLSGFTLTNGATQYWESGGGLWCESVTAVVSNCVVVGNSAVWDGGGATGGTLNNCTLTGNWAGNGGGAYQCTLNYCTLAGNSAANILGEPPGGGGAYWCTLNNCTLTGNSASQGGGAYESTLNNCTLTGNSAYGFFGMWNGGPGVGGGAYGGTLNNCTLTGNSAYDLYAPMVHLPGAGGGAYGDAWGNPCTLNNCIVYFNTASSGANYRVGPTILGSTLNYCCTTPDPGGVGNIANDPLFVDQANGNLHLQTNSLCINAGNNSYVIGTTDLDGNPRIASGIVDLGAYEFQGPAPLSVGIAATFTNVATGFSVGLTALFYGHTSANLWDFGDGIVASNLVYATHAWATPGDYAVVLWAYNESHPEGLSATQMVHVVVQPVHYVATSSINPLPPYSSWATAATSIQDAVDAGTLPGALVLVSNGVYSTGGRVVSGTMTNRVAVDKPLTVRSVNGPQFTVIQGYRVPGTTNGDGAVRCVYLTNSASLSGFTLTNGATRSAGDATREQSGGGLWCESATAVVSNCVVVGNGAAVEGGGGYGGRLSNCTLTGNFAQSGGGVSESVLSNCALTSNSAGKGGGANGGTLSNCTLTGNWAGDSGGGSYQSTLNNCTLTSNSAGNGGGANGGTLNACAVAGNLASNGGGAIGATLNNCTLTSNSAATDGGGANGCTLNNCTLTGNRAASGGGANGGTLNNCTLTGNSAGNCGGGANGCTLNNCTLTSNSANGVDAYGGGASGSTLNNCIVFFNTADVGANYDSSSTLNYCCTTPQPTGGTNNLSLDPQLASTSHLSAFSPCRGAGNAAYATGTDIDGEAWGVPPSIGCDEYHAEAVTGPLSVAISAAYTNVAVGFPVGLTAVNEGRTTMSIWEFGDGGVALNRPYVTHAWTEPGDYVVALWAFNDSPPEGVNATVTVHVMAPPVHYVAAGSANPQPPYTSWGTAAANIQDAVDAATVLGAWVLVTNGVYATGGRAVSATMTNRVVVDKPVTLRSVSGPQFTTIQGANAPGGGTGDGAIRCVYLANSASLSGFTLTNGATRSAGDPTREQTGGGLWCESAGIVVSNCVVTGNSAQSGGGVSGGTLCNCTLTGNSVPGGWSGGYGGGAYYGTLKHCTLTGNSASKGGGSYQGTLDDCTLSANSATEGGGAYNATLDDCTLSANSASNGGGACASTLNNCRLSGNSASNGGGACQGALNNCTLSANSATSGGGAYQSTLNDCTLSGNSAIGTAPWTTQMLAVGTGGGACYGTLNNCALSGNLAEYGGGAGGGYYACVLNNCTLNANWAANGGGAYCASLNNCVVYFNNAAIGANYDPSSSLSYCCTTPQPTGGTGNISLDPQLASASHLSAGSPCRGAGSAAYAAGTDIDGEAWGVPPSMGCDEYHAGAVTGLLSVAISAPYTNAAVGFPVGLTALIEGRTSASVWDFGDGIVVSNRPYASHAWAAPGDYVVVLWAYNESQPAGVSATVTVRVVSQPVYYVAAGSANPQPPYTSWATAARNIQDAVDAATVAGAWVRVTNGVYASGGRAVYGTMTNRVVVDKPLTVWSVNGPQFTTLQGKQVPGTTTGDGAVRCVYLANGGGLSGFTLTKGATRSAGDSTREQNGGGLWCEFTSGVVSNCVVAGNSAYQNGGGGYAGTLNNCTLRDNSAGSDGGGAAGGTLNQCTLTGNSASGSGSVYGCCGGGAYQSTLNDCTLSGNSAADGGGAYQSTLNDCTLSGNSAENRGGGGGGAYGCTLNNCRLSSNSADYGAGGGALGGTLNNCTLNGNSAAEAGGGARYSTLNNCTLTGNSTFWPEGGGGGACDSTLNNCTLTRNSAWYGGGALQGALNNCTLTANSATASGGGALGSQGYYGYTCTLNNCTLTGNSAGDSGGGTSYAALNNCIVYFNTAKNAANYDSDTVLNHCCTTPQPSGAGNITLNPLFVNRAGGNLRLQSNSPCINAGSNAYAAGPSDLDGNPRIIGGTVDIGAYECQSPVLLAYFTWLQSYSLPTDAGALYADSDGDGLNNWQEWRCGTDPTNSLSVLKMLSVTNAVSGVTVSWQSVAGVKYFLECGTNLSAAPCFTSVATNLPGQTGTTTFTDTNAVGAGPFFYRVGVGN